MCEHNYVGVAMIRSSEQSLVQERNKAEHDIGLVLWQDGCFFLIISRLFEVHLYNYFVDGTGRHQSEINKSHTRLVTTLEQG